MALSKITNSGIGAIDTLAVDTDTLYVGSANNRVGIGTTSPDYLTEISGNGGGDAVTLALTNAGSDPARLRLNSGHGNWSVGNSITVADALEFRDESVGSTRMLIDSSGNVAINTTSPNTNYQTTIQSNSTKGALSIDGPATNGYWAAEVDMPDGSTYGIVFRNTTSSNVGNIRINASSTSYNTTSDYRLKENVVADWDATTRLKQLNPVRFNFIVDPDTTVDGFLAHEVQSVVPEAISGTHNEVDDEGNPVYQGIDQSKLVPLLVKTIQELEARIAALENA